jgi:hypothetical protein
VPALAQGVLFAGSGALAIGTGASTLLDALNANNSFATGRSYGSVNAGRGAGGVGDPKAKGGVYVLKDKTTGQIVRSGKTADLGQRKYQHQKDVSLKEYDFEPVYRTDLYEEQMGLEQHLHEIHNPPLNFKNPVAPGSADYDRMRDAATSFLNRWQ